MVPLRSLAGIIAVVSATPCSAFLVPGPKQAGVRGAPASFPAGAATAPGLLRSSSSTTTTTKIDVGKSRLPLSFSTVDATDAAAAAAAVGSGTNARRLSGPGRQTAAAGPLKAVAGAGEEPGDGGKDLTSARRAVLLTVWLCFTAYAFGPWSPGATGDPADTELVVHLYDAVVPQTAVFVNVFNSVGAMAPILGSLLVGGGAVRRESQPVPPLPFVFGTFALGFISMGPYLALRNYVPGAVEAEEEMSSLEKAFTSKLFAAPLLALAVYTYYALFSALADPAAVSGFADLFGSSKLANVSTIDLTILTTAVVDPLREDMRRRGVEPEAAKVALFALPLVGPTLWMLIRPPVERG